MAEIETNRTDNIICPYCGYEDIDSWENDMENDGDIDSWTCGSCDEEFNVELHVDVSYTSTKRKEDDI